MADSTASVPPRPVKTLQKQWLEVLGAMHYVLAFVVLGPFSIVLLLLLLFTRLWSLSVLYMLWIYLDRDTPSQGGRRCEWTRRWRIWKHQRDYFPIKLVKTAELPPSQNYVLGAHPHGIMSTAPFCNFLTECNNFSRRFPGLQPWVATLAGIFYVPVFRDYIMLSGEPHPDREEAAPGWTGPHPHQHSASPSKTRRPAPSLVLLSRGLRWGIQGFEYSRIGAAPSRVKRWREGIGSHRGRVTAPHCS